MWHELRKRNLFSASEYWFERELEEIDRKSKEDNEIDGKKYKKDEATIDKDKRVMEKERFGVFLDDFIEERNNKK